MCLYELHTFIVCSVQHACYSTVHHEVTHTMCIVCSGSQVPRGEHGYDNNEVDMQVHCTCMNYELHVYMAMQERH